MAEGNRYRSFTIVFYAGAVELNKFLLKYSVRISHYAYIVHDKDVYQEDLKDNDGNYVHKAGEIEKPHIHLLVDFYNAHTPNAVKKLFTTEVDKPRVERVSDKVAQYEYLIHKNDPDKYQYPKSSIVSDDINWYDKLCISGEKRDSDDKAISIVNDILAGISPRILMHRYGRDFIIHYNQYKDMADLVREHDYNERISKDESFDRVVERELEQMGIL